MSKIQLLLGFGALRPDAAFDALAAQPVVPLSSPAGTLSRPSRRSHLSLGFKRLVDIVVSALAILALLLVFLLVALAILVCDGGPVVYRHKRIGRNGRSFHCYKFRTMARDADARLQRLLAVDPAARKEWEDRRKLKKDPRVHRIGDFLRRSSLDELPQLFNILSGDMSLVGPRPIVAEEIVRFGPHFTDYKSVRPGLTGLWQISGRSDTTYEQRVALDQYYAAHGSTAIDLRILMKTPAIVLRRDGSC